MKVLLINGSPHQSGCTYTALREVAGAIEPFGIETEIVHVGAKPIIGCTACGKCRQPGGGPCVFGDDGVNACVEKARESDGFVFGTPVHYAAASGAVSAFLDRCFYSGNEAFAYKPGAAVVSCRRGGASAAFEQLNKYFTISCMPVVSSRYWNMVHGNSPEEVKKDLEGMQTMRVLGRNMAWLLRAIELGRARGILPPDEEPRLRTNFIR